MDVFQQTTALEHPPFACNDEIYIIFVKTPVVGNGVNDDTLDLSARQPTEISNDYLHAPFGNFAFDGFLAMKSPQRSANNILQFFRARKRNFKRSRIGFCNLGQFVLAVNHDKGVGFFLETINKVAYGPPCQPCFEMFGDVESHTDGAVLCVCKMI